MGFGPLRVINEDQVEPGKGFDTHGHRDMEIISYVLEGALEHRDSMGNGSVIRPGDVQLMSAGTGVRHSEINHSDTDPVHFLQIWILPEREGLKPGYEQKAFPLGERQDRLQLAGSRDGREGSITIHQDVHLFATVLTGGEVVNHDLSESRKGWLQVVRGTLQIKQQTLYPGDSATIEGPQRLPINATSDAEALLFDMNA
jgi:redox-sensitive bicupin YhaK (pirin superfamily)